MAEELVEQVKLVKTSIHIGSCFFFEFGCGAKMMNQTFETKRLKLFMKMLDENVKNDNSVWF